MTNTNTMHAFTHEEADQSENSNVVDIDDVFQQVRDRQNPYLQGAGKAAQADMRDRLPFKYATDAAATLKSATNDFPNHNVLTLAAALAYADAGLTVIDGHALDAAGRPTTLTGEIKVPRGTAWQKRASNDADAIKVFWSGNGEYPANKKGEVYPYAKTSAYRNVNITFPENCGLFVLDIDGEHGLAALEALENEHGPLPQTWESVTGSGGVHLIFKAAELDIRNTASAIAPGVDIRGKNGQIVAAPSIHPSGNFYRWDDGCAPWECEVAEAPEWLMTLAYEATKGRAEQDAKAEKGTSKRTAKGSQGRVSGLGFDGHVATIGDGDDLRGFDAPIYSAALSYFGSGEDDEDALIETLRDAILVAPCTDNRNARRYAQDDYLINRVEQAREYIAYQNELDAPDNALFENPSDWMPAGYKIKRDTIYKIGGDDEPDLPICQRFGVVGRASSLDGTEGAGRIISFVNLNGETIEMTLDRADLYKDNGGDVVDRLAAAEMVFGSAGKKWRESLLNLLRGLKTQRQIPTVITPGWVRDRVGKVTGFMQPNDVLIKASDNAQNMRLHEKSTITDRESKGTLEGWQVAADAALSQPDNFYWTLGLVAGFVGPLQTLIGAHSCGLNLSGDSSLGKTLAQTLGASVWGNPFAGKSVLHGMNSTQNAIEDLAVKSSGTTLALDEIGQMQRLQDLSSILFNLGSGSGKARKAGNGAGLVDTAEFQVFVVLSNEHALKVAVEGAGGKYKTGLSVRFPDVDVSGGKKVSADVLSKLDRATLNFGHAGPTFIRYLIDAGWTEKTEELKARVADAADKIAGPDAAPATRRAAMVFAMARVAGELAVDAGLLADMDAIQHAVNEAFTRFKGSDEGRATDGSDSMLDGLRSHIVRNLGKTIVRAADAGESSYRDVIGWYTDDQIIFDKSVISDVAVLGLNGKLSGLLDALRKIDALEMSGKNRYHNALPDEVKTDGVVLQSRVPNFRIDREKLGV